MQKYCTLHELKLCKQSRKLNLQEQKFKVLRVFSIYHLANNSWWFKGWKECSPVKCQELHTQLHIVTLQKIQILSNTSVTTSYLVQQRKVLHTNRREYMHFKATLKYREVDENCSLLCYYATSNGNLLPTFWDLPECTSRNVGKKLPLLAA